jgi:hypothetical protein
MRVEYWLLVLVHHETYAVPSDIMLFSENTDTEAEVTHSLSEFHD